MGCRYVSAEIVCQSLILTDISGNTTDINLRAAEVHKVGESFFVSSWRTKSKCIPMTNTLLDGEQLDYDELVAFISSIGPFWRRGSDCWEGGGGPDPELSILLLEDGDFVLLENGDYTLLEV
jgi:hypothetical protein